MKYEIHQKKLNDEVKRKIYEEFGKHAVESTGINGLDEDPISFEVYDSNKLIAAIVLQMFWGQLHIKYLFVEKAHRGQGIAQNLLNHACEYGQQRGCEFAFVETMSFQAPDFYQRNGFNIDFSRPGYKQNTTFHYLKKNLIAGQSSDKKMTRIGVYGVVKKEGKMLFVRQKSGPYAGKLDFPGGGIEFGESAEQALRREFVEEVSMEFETMELIDNLTAEVKVPSTVSSPAYTLFHIGMIYRVKGLRPHNHTSEFQPLWEDPQIQTQNTTSALVWEYLRRKR